MAEKRVILFIPAYNCSAQITRVLQTLNSRLPRCVTEVVVVNNRSTDSTGEVVDSFIKSLPAQGRCKISHLLNTQNYGLGGSHKVAFRYALDNGFDGVITLHGDDQANLEDFRELVDRWAAGNVRSDALLGSRFSMKSKIVGYSFHRTWGNYFLNFLWSLILLRPISDIGSGLNFLSAAAIRRLDFNRLPNSLVFNPQQLLELIRTGTSIEFYPIEWKEEDQQSNAIPWKIFIMSLTQAVQYRLGIKPALPPEQSNLDYSFQVISSGFLE